MSTKRKDQWIRGFATATASINNATAETHDELIVALVEGNNLTLEQLRAHAEDADFEEIERAFGEVKGVL